jgi:hypothetical protein
MVRFVDLVEAFASINREMMWQILVKYGIPPESLVNVIVNHMPHAEAKSLERKFSMSNMSFL